MRKLILIGFLLLCSLPAYAQKTGAADAFGGGGGGGGGSSSTYIGGATSSAIGADAVVFRFVAASSFTLPASLTGSYVVAGTAATSQADFVIKKNGSTFCTARFASSGTTATYTSCSSSTSITAGDVITVVAPSTPDATLADLAITLKGN